MNNIDEVAFKNIGNADGQQAETEQVEFETGESGKNIFDILTTKTGHGHINDYLDNPLNYDSSKETAQILRGLSGFTGDLDLALVDILIGSFRKFSRKKGVAPTNE